jgi:hypothetical protein
MYKLIDKIINIQNIYTSSDNNIFVDKEENYYLNGTKENLYNSVYFVLDGYILKKKTESEYSLFLGETLIKELTHSYIFNTYSSIGCFYYENLHYDPLDDKIKKDVYFHNFTDNSIKLFKKDFSENFQLVINENAITFKSRTTLRSLSLLTGEYEWEVDLGLYGEVRKIIGVCGENLWVTVNDAEYGQHHLLVIDIQLGIVKKTEKLDNRFSDFGVMLTEQQTIFSLRGRLGHSSWLYEYDAQNMQEIRALEVSSLKEKKLGVKSFTVYKDYIYFTATDDSQIVANTLGVLDYNTLELLWHEKVNPGNLILDPPQVTDTHLYVLGAEGTLHIFEKEA